MNLHTCTVHDVICDFKFPGTILLFCTSLPEVLTGSMGSMGTRLPVHTTNSELR